MTIETEFQSRIDNTINQPNILSSTIHRITQLSHKHTRKTETAPSSSKSNPTERIEPIEQQTETTNWRDPNNHQPPKQQQKQRRNKPVRCATGAEAVDLAGQCCQPGDFQTPTNGDVRCAMHGNGDDCWLKLWVRCTGKCWERDKCGVRICKSARSFTKGGGEAGGSGRCECAGIMKVVNGFVMMNWSVVNWMVGQDLDWNLWCVVLGFVWDECHFFCIEIF